MSWMSDEGSVAMQENLKIPGPEISTVAIYNK